MYRLSWSSLVSLSFLCLHAVVLDFGAPDVNGPGVETVGSRVGSVAPEVDVPGVKMVRSRVRSAVGSTSAVESVVGSAVAVRSGVVSDLDGGPE